MKTRTADEAYMDAHNVAVELIQRASRSIFDVPAAGDDEHPINWGHVGSMNEIVRRLNAVVACIEGTEQ